MTFDLKTIKKAILNRHQIFVPMTLVSSLLLVGYAALDKEAPMINTDVIAVNYGEELDFGKIQIEDNQTSYEDLVIDYDTTTLDLTKVGTSYLTVQATDLSNNIASKIVEVKVIDQEKPVYTLAQNGGCKVEDGVLVIDLNASNNITDYIKAIDNADGDLTAYINQVGVLDTTTPSKQAVSLSVTDNSGNTNEKTFDIEVRDISAPVVTYVYGDTIEVPYGCEFDLNKYMKATDNSGKLAVFAPTEPWNTKVAEHTYTIVASDEAGNSVGLSLTVITKDVTGPTIKCEARYEVTQGKSFDLASKVSAIDDKDGKCKVEITGNVNTNVPGTYTLTVKSTDLSGNTSTKSVAVVVKQSNAGILPTAKSKLGSRYVSGGTGPNAFDCSGFTQWVYRQNGKSIPRTTWAQYGAGTKISYSQLQPGDLIFFSYSSACDHVGIYAGNGMVIHAATVRLGVCYSRISDMTKTSRIYGCARF